MSSFLIEEREQASWRFLVIWILASAFGFAIGAAVEILIVERLTLFVAIPLSALTQAYVINRHISIYLPWAVGTTLFWLFGLAVSSQVFTIMMPTETLIQQALFLVFTGGIAGVLAGIPQWIFMRDWLSVGPWWLVLSIIEYALFFIPGIISGLVLMRLITVDKIPMGERHYEVSGQLGEIQAKAS